MKSKWALVAPAGEAGLLAAALVALVSRAFTSDLPAKVTTGAEELADDEADPAAAGLATA